ncbi:hydroxyethylthiazole kinase [Microbacterium mangrovi]|uniref:hydroxyethylthiazole kinase n=1 Tax=Microbacterium mangrovi TaxID=1348253 RepID=UPI0006924BB1|nr:hydroxyethylthiazole kinase [Microbacterium mangrovi]
MRDRLSIDPARTPELLQRLRDTTPLTHCITNAVVTNFTANALLAIGAAPAMVDLPGEAGLFAGIAGGLLVNLGTPHREQRDAALEAARAASEAGTPWVLDPVAIGVLPVRTSLAHDLAELRPTAIRGNASEVLALAGTGSGGRGVDAADTTDAAEPAAVDLARRLGSVVAVSGAVDLITDGDRVARVAGGSALLTRVTGGGCALGALTAAFLGAARGSEHDAFAAVVAAHDVYSAAAEVAASGSPGPGTFAVRLLDALHAVAPADLAGRDRVRLGGTHDPRLAEAVR